MTRLNWILLSVILISLVAPAVISQLAEEGEGGQRTTTGENTKQVEQAIQTGEGSGTVPQTAVSDAGSIAQGIVEGRYEGRGDNTYFERVHSATLKDGGKIEGGQDVVIDKDGDYTAARISSADQGLIIIHDGINVGWENGVMTADSARDLDYKGSTSNDIILLVADNKKFSVGKASAVQAGCFLVEDVNDASFVVGHTMTMTTSGSGKVVYDQGQKMEYAAKDLNSSIVGSITACRRPTYQVKAMELNTRTGNLTEIVNGSGEIQLDGRYGVVCINLTPVSTYDVDTGRYEDSFGFVIRDYAYKLCIQKAVAQQLVADCPLCGLVDLANNKLLLNGVIEYVRYLYDTALIDADKKNCFQDNWFW